MTAAESVGTSNTNKISSNTAAISSNAGDITELQNDMSALYTCSTTGKDYNPTQNQCVTRPNLGILGGLRLLAVGWLLHHPLSRSVLLLAQLSCLCLLPLPRSQPRSYSFFA